MNRQLTEVASWRIVCELFRRFPGKFQVIETHPGGGMYDCLSIFSNTRHVADFNRAGSFHVFDSTSGQSPLDIWHLLAEEEIPTVLDQVCRILELQVPTKLPPSTADVIVYRFIATLLGHSVFGKDEWECRNGYFDSSGMVECGIHPAFDLFLEAKNRARVSLSGDLLQIPAYRFWFIKKNGIPVICLETTGTVWNADGQSFDLTAHYKKEKRIWPIVWTVAGHLLP
jgi:hypothetical protein